MSENLPVGPTLRRRLVDVATRAAERPDECIRWPGSIDSHGYGVAAFLDRTRTAAHRLVWQMANGPVPDGLVVDHLCRNRWCVNVNHLDVTTNRENIRRGLRVALRTHCAQGHPFDGDNLVVADGRRYCRTCRRESSTRARERRRALAS